MPLPEREARLIKLGATPTLEKVHAPHTAALMHSTMHYGTTRSADRTRIRAVHVLTFTKDPVARMTTCIHPSTVPKGFTV